jgi:hypothetical protein
VDAKLTIETIVNFSAIIASMLNGLDLMLLLKLSTLPDSRVPSKRLAEELFLEPSEITRSLKRCRASGLVFVSGLEKRVNRPALLEFLIHGFRYVFPAEKGSMTRGVPTGVSAEPLKSRFIETGEPPTVWPYAKGKVRGIAFAPLHKRVPEAAMNDPKLHELLALADGLREDRVREREIAKQELTKRLEDNA